MKVHASSQNFVFNFTFYIHTADGNAGFYSTRSFRSEMWNCVHEPSIIQILSVTDR
jgi:hypothetical protein